MKVISKEMRNRQKHFPWLKTFIQEFFKSYPNCKETLNCLVENIEKEVKELMNGSKQKKKLLFETVNGLYLHLWWKIHWKEKSLWINYWNVSATHFHQCSGVMKSFGKLLHLLIYLGIILSQGASNSVWLNQVLLAINMLPVNNEIVYNALLQMHILKKKYRSSYVEILRHVLCSELILKISEPATYVKSLMLFRRLKCFTEDKVAKASLISTASRIKPPSNLDTWLSSLEISIDVDKSIVDQLLKKNSKEVFQKLYHALIDSKISESNNEEQVLKSKKKSNDNKNEENLLSVAVGIRDPPKKDKNCTIGTSEEININGKNNQIKKVHNLSELCDKIKNSKKKKKRNATNRTINSVNSESNTKSMLPPKNAKIDNLIERTLDSQDISGNPKKSKKKKSKAKIGIIDATVANEKNDTKSKKMSKNKKSGNKKSKKKKPMEIHNGSSTLLDNEKGQLSHLETHSNEAHSSNGSSRVFADVNNSSLSENNAVVNEEKNSKGGENSAIKEIKLAHSAAQNKTSKIKDKTSNKSDISFKLPTLLANYEIYSSAEENETAKRGVSSCPLVESGDNVLVPDTCPNDFSSIVPFNLDSWIPSKDDTSRDTSVSNDGSLKSDKYPYDSLTDTKRTNMYQSNQSDNSNSSFNDSAFEYTNDSEVSRGTLVSSDGSYISDKYPYVSLVDIRKNKNWNLYQNSDYSNSSFGDSAVGQINDSEVSQDTCISYDGSQISDKIPYVSLVDIKKMKNRNLSQKSDCSDSSFDSSGNINDSKISPKSCILNEESQLSDKDPNDIKKVDKSAHHNNDSNYDPILGYVPSNKVKDVSNQDLDSSNDLLSENRNDKSQTTPGKNCHRVNKNKDSESPWDKTLVQSTQHEENLSPSEKHSKPKTLSMKQDMVNTNLKTPTSTPSKRQKKQTNNNIKNEQKKKHSSDDNEDLVKPKKGKHCQELETSANDVYLNDLSTLLPNHGDVETQKNEVVSPPKNIALNHSDAQDSSQLQEHNTLHEQFNILPHKLNGEQSASVAPFENSQEQPRINLPNENHQSDVAACSIETVLDEYIESQLSKVHVSSNSFNSDPLNNDITEKAHPGGVHSVGENARSSFGTGSDLVPPNCFSYESNFSTPQQNNNQNNILAVLSSSTTGNRSMENEVTRSLLNLSVDENSRRIALSTNPDHRNGNANLVNTNLHSGNSTYVVDCNIINDFDSRNSSRAGSSVSGDTTTIKVVLNLINAKAENSSNTNPSVNGCLTNSSQGLHPSVEPRQMMNRPDSNFPVHGSNSYFSAPPFITRTVSELETPPESESQWSVPIPPRVGNTVSSCPDDKINFISAYKSRGRSSTPNNSSKKRQHSSFSHSSESTNEFGITQHELNSSFSIIPSLQPVHSESNAEHSTPISEETSFHNPRQIVPYRNSRPNIYSDEGEDELSVSTMSLLSGEETDHSLLNTTKDEISPKTYRFKEDNSSKNKRKFCPEEKLGLNIPIGRFLTKPSDNKITPKIFLHRKNNNAIKNQTKKLFREDKWALDTPTAESSVGKKSTPVNRPTPQKRGRKKKESKTTKKLKIRMNHKYNLRSRNLLTPPTKLMSYITDSRKINE